MIFTSGSRTRSIASRVGLGISAVALTAAALVASPATSGAVQIGPNPTAAALNANGPFAVTSQAVNPSEFNQGTIYTPAASAGVVGAVVITPGFTARQSSISWLGPRLASHGFVVMTIDTNSTNDSPSARATQMGAALSWLVGSTSPVASRVDANRTALMGHSMGGGGTMQATQQVAGLDAAIPLTPWHTTKSFPNDHVPTAIIGAQNDNIASVGQHAQPFYNSIPAGTPKVLAVIAGGTHSTPNSANQQISVLSIAWLKRFVDGDTRYTQFACNSPGGTSAFSSASCS
jgi:alpha-beta hydrolase superfamily lysophospholipase